jgi:uncharacterized protein
MVLSANLNGVRVWLSAAIPAEASESQAASMLRFIEGFAARVFQSGGSIIHGSHPSVTPALLKQAQQYADAGGRKDCLTLAVSRFWSKDPSNLPIRDWREHCLVYETPEASGPSPTDESLKMLRQWMASRCDAFVAVGGLWWKQIAGRAGIPLEAALAMERGIPCFLLGGLGGAAADYVNDYPEVMRSLKNGLDLDTNRKIATDESIDSLVDVIADQLSRLPLIRGSVVDGVSFRILALDGGGIKGAFTAAVLASFEKLLGGSIVDHFDLIAGTSTGGILALGLACSLTADEMLKFYRERGPIIFPMMRTHNRVHRAVRHYVKVKFSQETLYDELARAYSRNGPQYLKDARCRLVIPAYGAVSGSCHVFRTPHHPLLKADENINIADVALATAAAPTYFSSARVRNLISNASYFDGGVWANCPAMAAIIEAACYLYIPLDRIDILSIGTTYEPFTIKAMGSRGLLGWRTKIVDLLMNAQMESSLQHAELLVGKPRFLRINSVTPPKTYELDNSREIESLITLGNQQASNADNLLQVKSRFMNGVGAMDWREHARQSYNN